MANIHRVVIKGWMPFDVGRHEEALKWLGILNTPSYGLRIEYGAKSMGPVNEHGGRTTYHEFAIRGEEAIWCSGLEKLVAALVEAGCAIREAKAMDVEFDPDNMQWYSIPVPDSTPVPIEPGDPLLRLMLERSTRRL